MTPEPNRHRSTYSQNWGRRKRLGLPAAISAGSVGLVALLIACQQQLLPTATEVEEPTATILTLNVGDRVVIGLGMTVQFQVTPRDSMGQPVGDYVITWVSTDSSIVAVNDFGSATAVTLGTTALTVTAEKKPGARGKGKAGAPGQLKKNVDVTVDPEPVASVEVIPDPASMPVGDSLRMTAITRDADGNALEDRVVDWSSSNTAVAPVDQQGNVTGSAEGDATVTATSEGVDGDAAVSVTSAPPSPVVDLAVWPTDVTLEAGQQAQFYAAYLHADSAVTCEPESPSTDPDVLYNATLVAGCDSATARLDLSRANGVSQGVPTKWAAVRARARLTHRFGGGGD